MKKLFTGGNEDLPAFDLPTENELLKLKLRAEFGAECSTGSGKIPDEVINEFLRSVYQFEHNFRNNTATIRIIDKLESPEIRKADLLSDVEVSRELKRFFKIFEKHGLSLEIHGRYPERDIYRFITEEFLYFEIQNLDLPEFTHHFCYEDFHPNHELDIRHQMIEFLSQWFSKEIDQYNRELADVLVHPDSREFPKHIIVGKIMDIFNSYCSFDNCAYLENDLQYIFNDKTNMGTAFIRGQVRFDARLENGEQIHVEGPFEFYLSNSSGWWQIFYFIFPGFRW